VPQDGSTPVTIGQVGGDAMLAVSPDGEWIAAAGDRILRVWPAAGGEPRALEGHTQNTYSVAFSPDSTQLVSTGEDNRAFLWRLADGTAKELPHGGLAFDAVFSPDSRYVAVAGTPADVKVWTLDGALVRVLPGHARGARRLSWSATGRLATAGLDGVIRVFEPAVDGKAHFSLAANDPFFAVALSSDGSRVVACGMEGQVFHWKLGSPAERLIGHTGNVYAVVFSPDGSQIATASQDGTVRLWHAESRVARVLSFERPVKRLAFSPDGKTLAAGDEGGTVRLWPISDGDLPATPAELHQWIRARTSAEIDESGRPRSP
jgi:WD40 repeat protein